MKTATDAAPRARRERAAEGDPFLLIVVPFDPNRLSLNQRLHWRERKRRNDAAKDAAAFGWLKVGRPRLEVPVDVEIVVKRGRVLDPDNAQAGCKPIIDALFKNAVTPDDSQQWVRFTGTRVESGKRWKGREEVEFRINLREAP
jgi:hypothetical protein